MSKGTKLLASDLRRAIRKLARADHAGSTSGLQRGVIDGQPFDSMLLSISPAYRKSRIRFRKAGGTFLPSFLSSPRSLLSPALLESAVEYSALEREYRWMASQKPSTAADLKLLDLRSHVTSVFHEQNHRTLWRWLPPAPNQPAALRRYLNLAESLIIATDMALADEIGSKLARDIYLTGAAYDPGTSMREEGFRGRIYRNYLQASFYATYLHLELYEPKHIPDAIEALFPSLGPLAKRAAYRASTLDSAFIAKTNLAWQRRNRAAVVRALGPQANAERQIFEIPGMGREPLMLPADPLDHRLHYLIAEPWLEAAGF